MVSLLFKTDANLLATKEMEKKIKTMHLNIDFMQGKIDKLKIPRNSGNNAIHYIVGAKGWEKSLFICFS